MKKIFTILLILICIKSQAQTADELYKKGVEYFRNNEFQNAKNTFEQSFKLNPDFKTYGMYVILTLSSKNFDGLSDNNKTLQYTLKLHSLNKIKSVYFFNVLNYIYLQIEKEKLNHNIHADEQNKSLNIIKSIDKMYNENPIDFSTNLNKVMSFVSEPKLWYSKQANSYQIDCNFNFQIEQFKTDKNFNNLVKIRPDSETGYFFRGCIRGEKGADDFKNVIKINPNHALSNFILYGLLLDRNDFSGEINNLSKAFKIEPNRAIESIKIDGSELEVLFFYAKYYSSFSSEANSKYIDMRSVDSKFIRLFNDKNYSEAIKTCDELIEKGKKNIHVHLEEVAAEASTEGVTLEETVTEEAVTEVPAKEEIQLTEEAKVEETPIELENLQENVELKKVYYYRGISNFNLNKYENALNDFNHIVETDPTISDAIAMRGAVKISLNDLNGALLDLNKAIELDNSDGYMYYYRGIAKNKLGDKTSACLDLKKAIGLGYDEASVTLKEICK